jgi:cytochrome c-type biogenesis protein CcmF
VENASFMPWLVGTALIHSLTVSEKRGVFKSWTVLLAILAFSLSLLGTFLVRSGVLTSVHAFATDPTRGVYILVFLMVIIGGSLAMYAWRSGLVTPALDAIRFTWRSRESFLLANNVLMVVAAFAILLGTLYPLFIDALKLGKISVGPPYFDAVFAPLMVPAAVLLAMAPFSRWRDTALSSMKAHAIIAAVFSVAFSVLVCAAYRRFSLGAIFALALGGWVCAGSVLVLADRMRHASAANAWNRLKSTYGATLGMVVAHFGIGVFVIGVGLVTAWDTGKDVVLVPNKPQSIAGFVFILTKTEEVQGPNYFGLRASVDVARATNPTQIIETLAPEKRNYRARGQVMTEAAIDMGFMRHVYVSLANPLDNGAWGARLQVKPFIGWIWFGCVFMALGGFIAMTDKRYRRTKMAAMSAAQVQT